MLALTSSNATSSIDSPRGARWVAPSFDDVYDGHFETVYRAARALGVSPSSIDDVVQDVFVVVHRRLAEFEGRSSLRTWLTRILVNVVREHRRRFARKENWAELPEELKDESGATPAEVAQRNQAVRFLAEILDGMDDDQRAVFVLSEIEQMEMAEIAEALHINVNTAYSRLRLARKHYERGVARIAAKNAWRETGRSR